MSQGDFKIQAYNKTQLSAWYKVGMATFKAWIVKIPDLGEYNGRAYTPAQVQKIVNHLGTP